MTTIQQVYNLLRAAGLTRAACLAFLGNWEKESNNEPNRLQGDYSSFRTVSKRYTAGIMDGSISRQQFMTDQRVMALLNGHTMTLPQAKEENKPCMTTGNSPV